MTEAPRHFFALYLTTREVLVRRMRKHSQMNAAKIGKVYLWIAGQCRTREGFDGIAWYFRTLGGTTNAGLYDLAGLIT
jgi:hypothetical protein